MGSVVRFKLVRERTQVSGTLSRFASSVESITSDWLINSHHYIENLHRDSPSSVAKPAARDFQRKWGRANDRDLIVSSLLSSPPEPL